MDKKIKTRIIILAVALVAALVIVGISSGVFTSMTKGYDVFFDREQYTEEKLFFVKEFDFSATGGTLTEKIEDPITGDNVRLKLKVSAPAFDEKGVSVKVTFYHDYSMNGGGIFTASKLCKIGESVLEEDAMTLSELTVIGDSERALEISSVKFLRTRTEYVFSGNEVFGVTGIKLSGVRLTVFEKR